MAERLSGRAHERSLKGVEIVKKAFLKVLTFVMVCICLYSCAEDALTAVSPFTRVFVLCDPTSPLNVRLKPNLGGEKIGKAFSGDTLTTDGKVVNGYLHIVDCSYEFDEGWVCLGYISYTPVDVRQRSMTIDASGRVACRSAVDGKRRRWAKPGQSVTVYAMSDEWAVTDQGYIKASFLAEDEK